MAIEETTMVVVQSGQHAQSQEQQQQPEPSSSSSTKESFHTLEQYKVALEAFVPPKEGDQLASTDLGFTRSPDPLVDEFLLLIARTGRPHLPWALIRPAFIWKLQTVMEDFAMIEAGKRPAAADSDREKKAALAEEAELDEVKQFIVDRAAEFQGTPFTIQRLCELLVEPTKHYHGNGVFVRAMQKNINVVTTITEEGLRVTGVEDEFGEGGFYEEEEEHIPVEQNFIVSVDELDEPLPKKMARLQRNGGGGGGYGRGLKVEENAAGQSAVVGTSTVGVKGEAEEDGAKEEEEDMKENEGD